MSTYSKSKEVYNSRIRVKNYFLTQKGPQDAAMYSFLLGYEFDE
jgi:hypothetical protein